MRHILCKAKRKDNDEYVEGFFVNAVKEYSQGERVAEIITTKAERICRGEYSYVETFEVDENTLCLYTGKNDKQGKKIWEHDVVKVFARLDKDGNALYYYYEIMWDEQFARFEGYEIYSGKTVLFDEMDDAEVVGNQIEGVRYSFPEEKICSFEKCQTCHSDMCWTGQIAREEGKEAYDAHIKMMDEADAREKENYIKNL